MKSRIVILFLFFSMIFLLLVSRVFYLQLVPNRNLARLQKSQYTGIISLPPQRGKILDRTGEELATTVTAKSLYADPEMISSPRALSQKLAAFLGLPFGEIYEKLTLPKRFVWIKRQMEPDVGVTIKSWRESGLALIEEGRRAYPNQTLLAQVLGFVGSEGGGLEGIEKKYDAELRGEKRSILSRRDARGRPLVVSGQIFSFSADGATVEMTIDKELQYELERELEKVTLQQNADSSLGVILDPATGEVLAMASYPTFDPALAAFAHPQVRKNRVVTDVFEPGSTFKVITAAAALRTGRILPNTKYFCENGKLKIGKKSIHEAETNHGFGWLSLAEILEVSSNIGSTKVAFDVGEESIKSMIDSFGFGRKTGIDFLGEAQGIINRGHWPQHLLSNVSFGHGVGVTALQMANAYSAIANGGKLMRPYLVKRVTDSENHVLEQKRPETLAQVLTPKEASMLTLMLSGATQDGGTGTLARVDGYPVAGKTGTAQKINARGGYASHAYVSSFAGFVPANNPQYTIYVVVDNPRKQFYGAQVAAPVFHRLASFALHRKGFMPVVVNENSLTNGGPGSKLLGAPNARNLERFLAAGLVPEFKGLTLREASALLGKYGPGKPPVAQFFGSGVAQSQFPSAGEILKPSQKIKIYFKPPR